MSCPERYGMPQWHLPNQPFQFGFPFPVLFLRIYIRIIKEIRDLKPGGQIFQNITAAWCTAAVKKQLRHLAGPFQGGDQLVQLFLIIYVLIHLSTRAALPAAVTKYPYGPGL